MKERVKTQQRLGEVKDIAQMRSTTTEAFFDIKREIRAVIPLRIKNIFNMQLLPTTFDNREEIEEDIQRNDEIAEKYRAQYPSKLKEKLSYGAD